MKALINVGRPILRSNIRFFSDEIAIGLLLLIMMIILMAPTLVVFKADGAAFLWPAVPADFGVVAAMASPRRCRKESGEK